ncbi:Hypothetical protein HVR_LOCUS629 [uncultured virus]|nr:Hypothetical protein HVR_LOCUS629 [uncultured virus]
MIEIKIITSELKIILLPVSTIKSMSRKITSQGQYKPFTGITVISFIKDRSKDPRWKEIFDLMQNSKNFLKYFTPLPLESYHMTLQDLVNEKFHNNREEFFRYLMLNFSNMEEIKMQIINGDFKIRFKAVFTSSTFGIDVKVEPQQIIEETRSNITQVMGTPHNPSYIFHITLAYRYENWGKYLNDTAARDEEKMITERITNIFEKSPDIICESPKLCYFTSMTEFIPL